VVGFTLRLTPVYLIIVLQR